MSQLLPPPFITAFDSNGDPISGAKLLFTTTGTTTPASVYQDNARSTPHASPVVANSAGRFAAIFLDPAVTYRVRLYDASDVLISDIDPVTQANAANIDFTPAGTGAVSRTVQAKLRERVTPEDFGAAGDGSTDDTAEFQAALDALASGGILHLGDGKTYKLSSSLVIERPVRIVGGTQEQCKLLFASGGSYITVGDGSKAAFVVMHTDTVITGYSGDARRSVFENFTVSLEGTPTSVRGIVVCAPAYFYQVRVENFTSGGFNVMAGNNSPIDGNANGSTFTNCISQYNLTGFYLIGDDANACHFTRCFAADCDEWGFYDNSLLGNCFVQCEADNNTSGGYFTNPAKPAASSFWSCYSETSPHFSVGPLCLIVGNQGIAKPARSTGGVALRGLPGADLYVSQPIAIASTDDIANSQGDSPNAGACIRIGDNGIDYKATSTSLHFKLNGLLSANYTDFLIGTNPLIRFPNSNVGENITTTRPFMPEGLTIGTAGKSGIVGAGSAAPASGTYARGAIYLNEAPAAGGKIGWVCVTSGTPGTWKEWGAIDA
jgi:hypothetical protein